MVTCAILLCECVLEDIGGAANVCWHLAVACTSQRQCAGLEGPQRRREARLSAIILCKGREAWREHHSQPDAACAPTPPESRTGGEATLAGKPCVKSRQAALYRKL